MGVPGVTRGLFVSGCLGKQEVFAGDEAIFIFCTTSQLELQYPYGHIPRLQVPILPDTRATNAFGEIVWVRSVRV